MSDSHSSSETVATLKLLLIGSSGTGKSSLLMRFVDGVFLAPDEISATIGVDFKVKVIDVEGKKYKLTIWVGGHFVSVLSYSHLASLTSLSPSALHFAHILGCVLYFRAIKDNHKGATFYPFSLSSPGSSFTSTVSSDCIVYI